MKRDDLVAWLDRELDLSAYRSDHSNNGLQVEGAQEVTRALFAVDGCLATFRLAAERGADFIFVHHGISWGGEPRRFTGVTAERLRTLFGSGINLYAAHLPLDANPVFGNNAELCRLAGLGKRIPYCRYDGVDIGFIGEFETPVTATELKTRFEKELKCAAQLLGAPDRPQGKAAVVSGGGGLDALEQAAAAGVKFLLTGELTHVMYHYALELDMTVLALGHYASETTGPRALMERVGREFGIETLFAELPTGL
ncbi:Nif3-like dinuclear metal center hexameric protein [Victivallis vadensis]|uniref:Nif3-like dinuclear metal center hexameric protein n=1 Tax=Victivallis vadensis TaxID=172901 RepID=UPI0025956254|nr:Nif3-like dinuclear metal center hexameric protein [Victivallis vadensis]